MGKGLGKSTNFSQGGGQMLSYLALKGDEFSKLTALNFRKQMKKLCNDNKDWSSRASDKKYDNEINKMIFSKSGYIKLLNNLKINYSFVKVE